MSDDAQETPRAPGLPLARRATPNTMSWATQVRLEEERPTLSRFNFWHHTRYAVLGLSTLCLSLTLGNSLAFNFTVICMYKTDEAGNGTTPELLYTNRERDLIFSSVAVGALIGTLICATLNEHFGLRATLTAYGILSSFGTLFTPFCVLLGVPALIIMRLLQVYLCFETYPVQGVALGVGFPAMGAIAGQWATKRFMSTFVAILSCYLQFGPVIAMPLGGMFCVSSLGWPALYYLLGGLTVVAHIAFAILYKNEPQESRFVSPQELKEVHDGKELMGSQEPVPYLAVLQDRTVIAIIVSTIGAYLGFQIFMQYGPVYLHKVLNLSVTTTGNVTALSYLVGVLVKLVAAPLSDIATCCTEHTKMLMFAVLSQGIMGVCILVLAALPESLSTIGLCMYALSIISLGLNIIGGIKCAQMVALQHTHFVLGLVSLTQYITILVLPAIITLIVPDNTKKEWSHLYTLSSILIFVSISYFVFVADSRPAKWTVKKKPMEVLRVKNQPVFY